MHRLLAFDKLFINTKKSDLSLNGTLNFNATYPEIDVRAKTNAISLAEVGRWISVEQLDQGIVKGSVRVKGTPRRFFHELDLQLERLSVQTRGNVIVSDTQGLDLNVSGKIRGLNPSELPAYGNNWIRGDINADIDVKGTNLNLPDRQATIDLTVRPSQLAGYSLETGHFNLQAHKNDLTIQDGRLKTSLGTVEVRGDLSGMFDAVLPKRVKVDGRLSDLDLEGLTQKPDLQGRINLDLAVDASLPPLPRMLDFDSTDISANVSARIDASRVLGIDIQEGIFSGFWKNRELVITKADFSTGPGRLSLSGNADFKSRSSLVRATASLPDLQLLLSPVSQWLPELRENVNLEGELSLSAEISGWWDHPLFTASIEGKRVHYNGVSAETFFVDGTWQGLPEKFTSTSELRLTGLRVKNNLFPNIEAKLNLSPEALLIDGTAIHDNGETLLLSGKVINWLTSEKKIALDKLRLEAKEWALLNQNPVRIRLSGDVVDIKSCDFASGQAILSLTGRMDLAGSQSVNVSLKNLDLTRISRLLPKDMGAKGIVSADLFIAGTPAAPVASGKMSARNGSLFDFPFSNLELDIQYNRSNLNVDASLYKDDKKIMDLKGKCFSSLSFIPFHFKFDPAALEVSASASDLPLSTLPIPKKSGLNYDGILNGTATLKGSLTSPEITADISIRNGTLLTGEPVSEKLSFSDLIFRFMYSRPKASISASLHQNEIKLLDVKGDVGMVVSLLPFSVKPQEKGLDLTLETNNLKLSALPLPRIEGLDVDGVLNMEARATGLLTAPILNGSLSLDKGRLIIKDPPLSYEELTASIRFSTDRIVVEKIFVKGDTEGALSGMGEIKLSEMSPAASNFRLTGENVFIPYKRAIRAWVSPDLTLSGLLSSPKLTGSLTIVESRINLDRLSDQGPAEIQVVSAEADKNGDLDFKGGETEYPAFMKPLAADVMVKIPNRAWLKGQGLDAEIGGNINLNKEPDRPFTLLGALNTIRGTYTFRGKRFRLTQGKVSFMGFENPDPALDIQGVYRAKDVDIIAKLTGTAGQINLSLESDPQMDQADVISYLFFGRPAGSLKGQQSLKAEQAALSVTGQLSSGQLNDIVEEMFHIDDLSIDMGGGDITRGSVSLGKYVRPDVFVIYRQGFSGDEIHQLEVTYEINRNLSVEALIGDEKNSGVDLIWEHDF